MFLGVPTPLDLHRVRLQTYLPFQPWLPPGIQGEMGRHAKTMDMTLEVWGCLRLATAIDPSDRLRTWMDMVLFLDAPSLAGHGRIPLTSFCLLQFVVISVQYTDPSFWVLVTKRQIEKKARQKPSEQSRTPYPNVFTILGSHSPGSMMNHGHQPKSPPKMQ